MDVSQLLIQITIASYNPIVGFIQPDRTTSAQSLVGLMRSIRLPGVNDFGKRPFWLWCYYYMNVVVHNHASQQVIALRAEAQYRLQRDLFREVGQLLK
jgi:hypothetical protein